MGGKRATTTSKVTIPPEVLARYNAVNARAETAASAPYEAFGKTAADYVAQMNAQQYAGIADINAKAGSYQPYLDQATSATQSGMGPAYAGIDNYMSPYIKNVADTTGAYMRQQQEQAQSGALGTAAMSGAFGGDRAGIAAANLQQQNQMGYGKTMADIMNQGYTQALGASQADLARQLQGGSQMAELGAQSQKLGLQGAQAKIAAGTMEQQTEQAGKDAMINQFMQEKGYPFQVAQFLANIAMGTGAASGSTTSTTTPRNWMGFADGGGVSGPRTYSQGQIGGQGYVPVGDLPVGQLMVADPPQQGQSNGMDEMIKMIKLINGMASGGVAGGRHGYATEGGVEDPGNRIRFDDALIEMFGGVKPVVSEGKDRQLPTEIENRWLGSGAQYPGSSILSPMTAEQLRNNINDPDYYDVRGYENALNLAYARGQAETNPANMGYMKSHNMGMPNQAHPYPPSPTTGVVAPAATLPTFTLPGGTKITLSPDGSSTLAYRNGVVDQSSKDQTDRILRIYGNTTAEEVRASQTPAPAPVVAPVAPTPTAGVVARQPNAAFQLSSEEIAANRAMMARSLGAREPRANERYMLPTGLSRPPSEALETLDFGAMLNAEDTTPVPVPATANVPGGVVPASSGPTMVDMEPVYSDIFGNITRDTRGNLYAENGTRMITDSDEKNIAAAQFNAEMKRRNLVAEQKVFEAGDSPLFLGDAYQAGLNVANAKEAAAQAQANLNGLPVQRPKPYSFFDVPQNGMPAAPPPRYQIPTSLGSPTAFGLPPGPPPTTGVVTPAMTTRPGGGVQQPMAFTAGEKPSYTLPTGLGTPPSNDLAPTTSPRPQLRPADLGTPPVVEQPKPELGAGIIVGNTMMPAPEGIGYDKDRLAAAVRFQESGSPSGNYGVLGAPVQRKDGSVDRAYGAYQIMGANIPQWTKEVLGYSMTPEEFLRDPQAQDTVAKAKLDQMYQQYGSIEDVASVWFSGRPLNNNNSIDKTSGKSVPSYVSDVMNKYYGGGEGSATNYNRGSVKDGVASFEGLGGADMTRQRDGLFGNEKPYEDRNAIGKFFYNRDGSLNSNAIMSLLGGLAKGAEAQTISPLGGILSGLGGGMETYKQLLKQEADIAQTEALTRQTDIMANASRFFKPEGGVAMVTLPDKRTVKYWDLMRDPALQAALNPQDLASIKAQAEAAGETTPPAASGNSIFTDATGKAILANEASYVEGPSYDAAIQRSMDIRTQVNADASSAAGMHDSSVEQLRAVSSLLSSSGVGSSGAAGSARAQIVKYANTILGSLGLPPVSDLDKDVDVLGKIRTSAGLAAANGADQNSVRALEMIANGMPNENITSEANAIIMSNILIQQQRAMDKEKLYSDFAKENPYGTVFGAASMFKRLDQKYDAERDALEKLVKVGGTKGTDGVSIMERLTSGELSPQDAQSLIAMALGGEAPTADMYRYFIPYQVKG